MLDAGGGGAKLGFVADTVARGPGAGYVATQTKFSVDPAEAQRLIDGLKQALEKLVNTKLVSDEIAASNSPGKDVYSGMATLTIRKTASDEPGGYGWANLEARKALENTIENIQKALDEYQGTDSAAADALKPKE
ncbi:hypothetical protein [Saccharothrix algeriensis]|uniref:Uncharacterized protein n=1 Tax=Saccharothrix algeriensis TaxID=173560 RepID=A0A8T8I2I4_9PSEU|nr:hypothetical protein [Saccharothrix algeriensis]MBM7811102.1 hypothetical protein [Saccharothrix algeriensis]QTR05042.1 hypothetical protein J7S33_10125 [Saccharothrix algeriensis]